MPRLQVSTNAVYQEAFLSSSSQPPKVKKSDSLKTLETWKRADAVCFDVDSTVIVDEGLDELASFCQKGELIKNITKEAMKGGVDFREALRARLNILKPSIDNIKDFNVAHPPQLTPGIAELVQTLHAKNVEVFLVSGGFRSLILPIAKLLNIPPQNVFANRLKFYFDGEYAGFEETEPTSRSGGKAEVIASLQEKQGFSNIVMVGDGATDLEACPPASAFIGFGGNVVRESVKSKATLYVTEFQPLIDELQRN